MADDQPSPLARAAGAAAQTSAIGTQARKAADPCAMVLFGATGDLAHRLVVPALYNLARSGALPERFALIGISRHESDVEAWRKSLRGGLEGMSTSRSGAANVAGLDEAAWTRLSDSMAFVQGDLADPALYTALKTALDAADTTRQTGGNVIFYLAVEDRLFAGVVERLAEAGLTGPSSADAAGPRGWRRVVVEKPFGHSLDSARALNADLAARLRENQIFRIDHFLGKDSVQNIIALRFANGLFESIWNRDHIDHVQITATETVGVESRGDFYEHTGALRDMVPNHLVSLLSLVAMEPPATFDAASFLARKADVLTAIPSASPARAVRGQYGAGLQGAQDIRAYRDEPDVANASNVETYAALELQVDNARWAGVPFFIRTGKHLTARVTEIAIRFKPAVSEAFHNAFPHALRPNWLILRIAPKESICVQFEVKPRGPEMELATASMVFNYDDWFRQQANVGYETLLYDVMIGEPILFMPAEIVERSWRIVQPVLDAWAAEPPEFPNYASGEAGPKAADALIARDGDRAWRPISAPAGPAR